MMKQIFSRCISGFVVLALTLLSAQSVSADAKDAKSGSRAASGIRAVPEIVPPQSVFVVPTQPGDGRNPFFPQSTPQPVLIKPNSNTPVETFSFVLNGITSPPKRTAMINGRTFETGEEGEVRLSNGNKILIKCVEIRAESALISFGGQTRELHLRSGL